MTERYQERYVYITLSRSPPTLSSPDPSVAMKKKKKKNLMYPQELGKWCRKKLRDQSGFPVKGFSSTVVCVFFCGEIPHRNEL